MKIIPGYIEENSPPGESMLFSSLQNCSNNWVAIHSLDLAPYNKNKRTEIDFIIIIPKYGIMCVEVKSQKDIYFDGDRWRPNSITRSPFKQALDARYAFRRRLKDWHNGRFNHLPVMHCCIFPCSDFFIESNISIKNYEVMDRRTFNSCKSPDDISKIIAKMLITSVDNDPQVKMLKSSLTDEQVNELIEFCYPIRKRKPENNQEIQHRQFELEEKLRIQQKPVINLVTYNNRVLIEGGAGTGKSLIGLEIAKRKAEEGSRVAYICFNHLIGKMMEAEISKLNYPNLIGGSVFGVLLRLTDVDVPENVVSDWWEHDALKIIEDKLTDPELSEVTLFDYMVIDEAQDILGRPSIWNCLKLFVDGGVENGNYLILGDFINQSLTYDVASMEQHLDEIINYTSHWKLEENCRNYKSIGEAAINLSDSDHKTWSGFMRTGGSHNDWQLYTYTNTMEQVSKINDCIQNAKAQGFKDSEISLLTFCTLKKSIIESLIKDALLIEKASEQGTSHISYATINSYKGMENKVIIITDIVISPQNKEMERKLFYTGITRATEQLFLLCRESTVSVLKEWVIQ